MLVAAPWKSLIVCSAVCLFAGCKESVLDGTKAMAETEALVKISPRDAGSGNARRAAVHLEARLKAMGLTHTKIDTFSEETPSGKMIFNNVLGRIPGKTNRLIVLLSHFDTKSGISTNFQGANDSGSSSGLLIELARVIQERGPFETEFMIAFVDGEECRKEYGPHDGLHGSRHLAQQIFDAGGAKMVEAVIVIDMIGDKNLNIAIPRNSSKNLIQELFAAADSLGVRKTFSIGPGSILDDHVPFLIGNMPAIDLIDFEYGSAPGLNDYWHTPQDTLDKLSVESLQLTGDVVFKMVENLQ